MSLSDPPISTYIPPIGTPRPARGGSGPSARPLAALVAASLLGGTAALAGAWALGAFHDPAPVVQATPVAASVPARASATGSTTINVADIYRRSGPGVVQITSTSPGQTGVDVFGNPTQGQAQQALGSGFVVDKDGHIVTNFHVVQGASRVEVSFSNQDTVKATIVGTDPSTDLAVLKVDAPGEGADAARAGQLGRRPGRRPGRRDRQPVRARPDGHRGDRQRPPARGPLAEQLHDRPRDPDRRPDQQRQLRRPA